MITKAGLEINGSPENSTENPTFRFRKCLPPARVIFNPRYDGNVRGFSREAGVDFVRRTFEKTIHTKSTNLLANIKLATSQETRNVGYNGRVSRSLHQPGS